MASVTGPPQYHPSPPPDRPRGYGLQSVATVITAPPETANESAEQADSRRIAEGYALRGVQHEVNNCGRLACWSHDCDDQDGDKLGERHGQDWVTASSFTVYSSGPDCSGGFSMREGPRRALERLQALEWAAVERAVLSGQCGAYPSLVGPPGGASGVIQIEPGNPDGYVAVADWQMFAEWGAPVMPAGTEAVPRADALALIEWAMRDYGGTGVIHAPSYVYPYFRQWEKRDGQRLVTQIGTMWAFGRGYWSVAPGTADPVEPDTPPDLSSVWLYATGAVRIWRSQPESINDEIAYDPHQNESIAVTERAYTVSMQCPHIAVNVDLTS